MKWIKRYRHELLVQGACLGVTVALTLLVVILAGTVPWSALSLWRR